MATEAQCLSAFETLAQRLSAADESARGKADFDRTLSCTLTDLRIVFGARLRDGELTNIRRVESADAQVRLSMTSDDLVALVDGHLAMAAAWARGRVKIDAGVRDLLRLRSIF